MWWFILGFILLFLVFMTYAVFAIRAGIFIKGICDNKGTEALFTFDDGPHPIYTPQVLDILRVNNIKAIFFCIGKNVGKYPEITRQIIAEGHQIGNHTFNHDVSGTFADSKKYILEITSTNDIIEKVTGIKPIFFRPPFGVTNPSIAKAVIKSGMQLMAWNLRTFDTVAKDPSAIVKKLQNSIRPSSIILMHDTNPQCVEALTLFFPLVKTNGN